MRETMARGPVVTASPRPEPTPLAGFPGLGLPLAAGDAVLRRWRAADEAALVAIRHGDPDIVRWTPVKQPFLLEDARATLAKWDRGWAAGTDAVLAIGDHPGGPALGEVGIHVRSWPNRVAELSYAVAAPARGRGLAGHALAAVRDAAIGLGLRRLVLQVQPGNTPSWRMAVRAGFRLEGIQRAAAIDRGRSIDLAILAHVARGPR